MGSKIQMSLVVTNMKNMLLVVMVLNYYVWMIYLGKLLKSYLNKGVVYNSISSMIKESNCSDMIKKRF